MFVTTLARAARKRLPPNFVVTIPKLMAPGHVSAVARACAALERRLEAPAGAIALELMIETPQSILAADGSSALRALVAAGGGRVRGAHFGTYDYTALCGITASWQHMRHAACDFAKHMMQVALAQTGVWLSDGATNIMPIPPHRARPDRPLTADEQRENRDVVHRAWKLHFDDVAAFARQRVLPGVGSASGAAADAVCRGLCVLPLGAASGNGAAAATSSRKRRRRRSSAMCSTMPRRGRGC